MYSSSKELTDAVNKGVSYETLLGEVENLIESRVYGKYIGVAHADIRQELRITLWNCWKNWNSESPSSFLNYFIVAMKNRLDKLYWSNAKHNQQVIGVQCSKCGIIRSDTSRGGKCECGVASWRLATTGNMLSTETLADFIKLEVQFDSDTSLDYVLPYLNAKEFSDVTNFIEGGKCIPYTTRTQLRKLMRVSST